MPQANPAPRPAESRQPPRHEDIARVVLIYAASAALWILLSDKAVGLLFSDSDSILVASMLKGWLFVFVTSALLWVLMRHLLARVVEPAEEARPIPECRSSILLVGLVSLAVAGVVVASVIQTLASERDKQALQLTPITHLMSAWVADSKSIGLAGLLAMIITVTAALLFRQRRALHLQRRVSAEQEQRIRTLQLLEAIADNSADAIFAKDVAGRYLLFNREASRIIGQARDIDVIGLTDHELFPSAQADAIVHSDREVMAQDRHASYEETLATAQGEAKFLTIKCPLHDAHGNVIGVFGIARDITVMRQAEQALRDREQKLAAIVGNSPSALSLKHPDGRYVLANPNLQNILGLSEAEIVGKTDFELYPEETARSYRANDEQVLSTRSRCMVEEVVPVAAEPHTFMSHIFPVLGDDAQVQYICRISLDITERKRAQESLQQLADDMRGTLQAIPDLLFELDEDGRYIDIKATHEPMLAVPAGQLLGRTVSDVLPPEAARTMMDALSHARSTGADFGRTITLPMATGPRTFELSLARKPGAADRTVHFVVISRDVTARVEAEASLRRQTTELAHRNAELERFNRVVVGRELDVIRLKQQVNALSHELGREAPFGLSFLNPSQPGERVSLP